MSFWEQWGPTIQQGAQVLGTILAQPQGGVGTIAGRGPLTLPPAPQAGIVPGMGGILGAMPGQPAARRMKRGRITGGMIPAGFQEKMSRTGVVYLAKSSRRRGISSRDLSSFRRVARLIRRYSSPISRRRAS